MEQGYVVPLKKLKHAEESTEKTKIFKWHKIWQPTSVMKLRDLKLLIECKGDGRVVSRCGKR